MSIIHFIFINYLKEKEQNFQYIKINKFLNNIINNY